MTHEKHETAVTLIAGEINRLEAELEDLRASYVKLGGVFEEDEAEEEAGPKRLAAPRAAGGSIEINGIPIALSAQQTALYELMAAAPGRMLDIAGIRVAMNGSKTQLPQTFKNMNKRLSPAGIHAVNVPRRGYRLEKLP